MTGEENTVNVEILKMRPRFPRTPEGEPDPPQEEMEQWEKDIADGKHHILVRLQLFPDTPAFVAGEEKVPDVDWLHGKEYLYQSALGTNDLAMTRECLVDAIKALDEMELTDER